MDSMRCRLYTRCAASRPRLAVSHRPLLRCVSMRQHLATKKDLLLFPCNGNAVEALDCLGDNFRAIGFLDDSREKLGTAVCGLPVLSRNAISDFPHAKVLAVPGSPVSFRRRHEFIASL